MFTERSFRVASFNLCKTSLIKKSSIHSKVAVLIDTNCENWEQSFDMFDEPFTNSYWIFKSTNLSLTTDILSHYPIEFNSDLNILSSEDNEYKIYEFYNTGFYKNGSFIRNEIGYVNSLGQLFMSARRSKLLTDVNLKLLVVYPDAINGTTFQSFLNVEKKSQIDSLHKLKFYMLKLYLRDMYKFKYKLQRTSSWGYLRNCSFDGLVGALQRKESDVGGTSVFFRPDRLEVIDYVAETWGSRICFIFRHPKHPGGTYGIYSRPLVNTVWYCTIALLVIIGLVLGFLLKLGILKSPGDEEDTTPSRTVLFLFSALGQQGMSINRRSVIVKIIIFSTYIFTLTVYQYYNAMLVSTLLRESPKTIRTLNDLLQSNIKIGVEDVIYNKDYFKRTTDPIAKALYNRRVVTATENNFYPPLEGMRLVKRGGFAFHVDTIIAYPMMRDFFTEAEICEVQEVYMIPPQKMGAILQKGSPYREHVSYGIRKMFETGIMSRLKSMWDEPKPPCIRTPNTKAFSVNIREFSTAIIILLVGMVFSVTILLVEVVTFRLQPGPALLGVTVGRRPRVPILKRPRTFVP
ncbi:unnamed protein product [Leptosia nina]|uniref:Ionotropic glutamate receptor C-terminal domain-containing protein n=1 Tax=Leptosia nina TaxID=320188 RepID=A0AAV1JMW3_9NEOP